MENKKFRSNAEIIARLAHKGQTRRDGVTPYIKHVEAVVWGVETAYKNIPSEEILSNLRDIAWLHDVIEDSDLEIEDLIALEFPYRVYEAVRVLTRDKDTNYDDYIEKIKGDFYAREVKRIDMSANLADNPTEAQKEKYMKAFKILCPEISNQPY